MFYAYIVRFNVMGILKNFRYFLRTKQSLAKAIYIIYMSEP